ncbi:hypothetical protein H0O00_03425 [Candidatus Micrarchaeota archaeon]|nr:hypothetical protein [Candidatus Micrarchaeota archaeon]
MAEKMSAPNARSGPDKPAKEAKTEKPKEKKGDDFGNAITSPFGQWWDYIKANFVKCYLMLLAIGLLALVAATALELISSLGGTIALPLLESTNLSDLSSIALLAGIILVFLLFSVFTIWLSKSISMTSVAFINSEFARQPFGIWAAANAIRGKVFRFLVVNFCIEFVIALPLIIVVVLLLGVSLYMSTMTVGASLYTGAMTPVVGMLALIVLMLVTIAVVLYYLAALVIYSFITQFWQYGFIVQGLGVVDALKQSFALVRKRPLECLIFDIALIIISLIAMIPAITVSFGVYFAMIFLNILVMLLPFPFNVLAMSLVSLVISVIILVFTTIAECVWLPTHYLFWKGISGK